jgi:epoxyqueuosine reductase
MPHRVRNSRPNEGGHLYGFIAEGWYSRSELSSLQASTLPFILNTATADKRSKPVPTAEWTPELEQWLHHQANASGFDTAGIAAITSPASPASQLTADRFAAWIDAGRAGEMDYLKRRDDAGILLRSEVRNAIPWARSIIVCAFNYDTPAPLSIDPAPAGTGWIARYAWSGSDQETQSGSDHSEKSGSKLETTLLPTDYHTQLLTRLQHLESALHDRLPCQTRCYVDTGPLIERAAAAQAGIGWIGKNTCVLNQRLGSWLLLGVIVTSLPVAETLTPRLSLQQAADRCGSCTRCIDACPTAALIAPRQMDASRCISYLTIEKKGTIPEDLRPLMGRQVFGCDICQDVCPWNRKPLPHRPPISARIGMLPRAELINPSLDWLASMDASTFKRYFKNSPLERTRRKRLLRNIAIAMGNSGQQRFLPTLQAWAAAEAEDPILAEAAQWALQQLQQAPPPLGQNVTVIKRIEVNQT